MSSPNKGGSRKDKNGGAQSSVGSNLMWPFIALIGVIIAIAIGIRSGGLLTTNQCDDTTDSQQKLMEITSKYDNLQEKYSEFKKEFDNYKTHHEKEAELECESPQMAREFKTTIAHLEDELSKCSSTRNEMEIKLATCIEQYEKRSETSSDVKNKQKGQDTKEKQDCQKRIQELNAEKGALKAEHKSLQIEIEELKKETEKDRKEAEKAQKKGERFQKQLEELIKDRESKQTEISKMKTKLRKCERDLDKMAKEEKNRDKKKNGK